jgi:hypothetical protein
MENEESTIFTSPQCMSSAERSAVKSGEDRGKKAAMAERPEYYGNIGSLNPIKTEKGKAKMFGYCKKCENDTGSKGMDFCGLPKNVRCSK